MSTEQTEYYDDQNQDLFDLNAIDDEVNKPPPVKNMDIVVILALIVLLFVFILSFVILVTTCRQRSAKKKSRLLVPFDTPPTRFTRSDGPNAVESIDSMEQLTELLGELLDKNPWLYEARGIMQHVVAVLTISRNITSKLHDVQMPTSPSIFHDSINIAIRNIYPRFDDLIETLAAQPIDMRLMEARAMVLGTVCWSLYVPFTLLDQSFKAVLTKPINEMNLHLVTIRTAAHLVSMAENGGEDLDIADLKDELMRMRRRMRGEILLEDDYETDEDLDDDEDAVPHDPNSLVMKQTNMLSDHHEKTPLVQSEAIIDMIELKRVSPDQENHNHHLMSNGTSSTTTPEKLSNSSSPVHHHHHHHHHHHQNHNGSLNTVEEMNEDDHHHEGTSTSCSSSSTSSAASSTSHPHIEESPPKA